MIPIETTRSVVTAMVEMLVTRPGRVCVVARSSWDRARREVIHFEIDVDESDRGRLIGRGGANLRALRVLLNSAAYVAGTRYRISCKEEPNAESERHSVSKVREFTSVRR